MTRTLSCLGFLFIAAFTQAQWPADVSTNLAVAAKPGSQVQSKIVPIRGGGAYISWFDNSGSGFDVYLQRLDGNGQKVWADEGVLIADRSFSSTQDYGLAVSGTSAYLVFRDDRFGGTRITFTRVNSSGEQTAGANGIQIGNGTDFVAAPKVSATMVAWTNNSDVVAQRLENVAQTIFLGDAITISDPDGANLLLSDLVQADGGQIISMVRQTTFGAPRQLLAQFFDFDLVPQWGAEPVAVFDSGSLQIGNFPKVVHDGTGGGVFAWYDVSGGTLQTYAQRIGSGGSKLFGPNGAATSLNGRDRVSPVAVYDVSTLETMVVWREQQPGSAPADGVYAQKFDAAGNRLWGDEGVVVAPLSSVQKTNINAVLAGSALQAFWTEDLSFSDQRVMGASIDAAGFLPWTPPLIGLGTSPSAKSRLSAVRSDRIYTILAWSDERNDDGDIYLQHVNDNGSTTWPDTDGDGVTNDVDNCTLVFNPSQFDSNGDGFGNFCDGDFNNDLVVAGVDLGLLRANFFTVGISDQDINGDGVVNTIDLGLFRRLFFQPPGPGAL